MKKLRYVLMIGMLLVGAVVNAQIQKGINIDGEAAQDRSGNSGHVRIYTWNDTAWVQKGLDIDGEAAGDHSGYSLSMPDSNTVAIGARQNDGNGSNSGHVRIYAWNGSAWVQKGTDIDGKSAEDFSGWAVSMPDSNTVAIGAPGNFAFTTDSGQVRIYAWNGIDWVQKGMDIDGEAAEDGSGCSISMPDANTVAIGAPFNDGNGYYSGHVRIYTWIGTAWVQKGIDIDGEADDFSGISVSMPDSNNVAIGAYRNNGNGTNAGQVRIYAWNGTVWVKKGLDINGEAAEDHSGSAISMPDANTVAIGAPFNDGNGSDAGHVRVYTSFCKTDSILSVNTCDSTYTSPSGNYLWSQSGTYMDTIPNTAGCDSIITIYLTFFTVDTFVINLSPHLIANAIPASYQCNNAMTPIIGQTYQSYVATANGSYAVEITQDGCVDTSACQLVNNIGIQKNGFDDTLSIYPNPTKGKITIECESIERIEVLDITGKVVYEDLVSNDVLDIDISAFSKGIYFVKVTTADGFAVERIVLE
jgi:hypothetical protein